MPHRTPSTSAATATTRTTWAALGLGALLMLSACSKPDTVVSDVNLLNTAGEAAMQIVNPKQLMARAAAAQTNAEKSTVLREAADNLAQIKTTLAAVPVQSAESKEVRQELVAAFGKTRAAAEILADAFARGEDAAVKDATQQMMASHTAIVEAGKSLASLSKAHAEPQKGS